MQSNRRKTAGRDKLVNKNTSKNMNIWVDKEQKKKVKKKKIQLETL